MTNALAEISRLCLDTLDALVMAQCEAHGSSVLAYEVGSKLWTGGKKLPVDQVKEALFDLEARGLVKVTGIYYQTTAEGRGVWRATCGGN